jgi:hypothetical protein
MLRPQAEGYEPRPVSAGFFVFFFLVISDGFSGLLFIDYTGISSGFFGFAGRFSKKSYLKVTEL